MASEQKEFIVSGFPREMEQAEIFCRNSIKIHRVIFYDVPQKVMVNRCVTRAKSSKFKSDGDKSVINNNIKTFQTQSKSVLNHFDKIGAPIFKIDGS